MLASTLLPPGSTDFVRYLVLAAVWVLAGRGLLRAAGLNMVGARTWLLAPATTQAFVAVSLGMSAVLRMPIRSVSPALWIAVLALALAGLAFEWIGKERRNIDQARGSEGPLLVLAVAVIVPLVALLPYFVYGFGEYPGTTHPDAWSYTVFGAYLWDYPRLTEGGLAPVYQWAQHLSRARYVTATELGWLAAATHEGDTQAAFGLLLAVGTFTAGSTCAAVGRVFGLPNRLLLLAAVGTGAGNWVANAILASNLDNLLAVSYLPALAALGLDETPTVRPGKAVVVGLFAAGALYTYPEFASVLLCCSALFFAGPLVITPFRRSLTNIAVSALTVGVLVWPYAPELWAFLRNQFAAGVSAPPRPGDGLFVGFLDPALLPSAIWALGTESGPRPWPWLTNMAAAGLTLLTLAGIVPLIRNRRLAALGTLALLLAGFSVFVWRFHYPYGAYKFVMLGWWLAMLAVVLGVRECSRIHPAVTAVAAALATATFAVSAARSVRNATTPPQPGMAVFRALRAVDLLAQGAPVAIVVADNTAAHWATYFLRGSKTRLVAYSGYLAAPHVKPAMLRAERFPWASLRLLLTDAPDPGPIVEQQGWKRLWRNSRYALWDTGDLGWAIVWQIDNPYPYAVGSDLVWVGDQPSRLIATASVPGIATIQATLGGSDAIPPRLGPARLLTTDGTGATCEWTMAGSVPPLSLGLQAGDNVLTLVKSWPHAADVPVADARYPFMFALVKPTLGFRRGAPDATAECLSRKAASVPVGVAAGASGPRGAGL